MEIIKTNKNVTTPKVHGEIEEVAENIKRKMELKNGSSETRVEMNTADFISYSDSC